VAHRYRLYPEPDRIPVLERHCADARFVWDVALEQLRRLPGRRPGSAERFRPLAEARKGTWLGEGPARCSSRRSGTSTGRSRTGAPGAIAGHDGGERGVGEGFCVRDVHVHVLNGRWAQITVPKLGPVRFRVSGPLPAGHGMARITRDRAGRWHVSFTAPQPVLERKATGRAVGLDLGVAATVATSDGQSLRCRWLTAGEAQRLPRLERRRERQRKGSRRRERTKTAIARLHGRARDRRKDFAEQTSTRLVRDHDVIAIEDLKVKRMLRSAVGISEQLGTRVAQKGGLNRSISRRAWSLLRRRIEDKAATCGVQVIAIDPQAHLADLPSVRDRRPESA
jgi:putative transposase